MPYRKRNHTRSSSSTRTGSLRVEALESRELPSARLPPDLEPSHHRHPAAAVVEINAETLSHPRRVQNQEHPGHRPLAYQQLDRSEHLAIARALPRPKTLPPHLHAQGTVAPGRRPLAVHRPQRSAHPMASISSRFSPIDPAATLEATPSAVPASSPYTPAQIRHAYGFDQLGLDGTGQTIAVIDAYDHPTIANDLAVFSQQFGLPPANLIKATPQGQPAYNAAWAGEIALDVEWAHAIAPNATILLVEARSSALSDLFAAVDYAVSQGVKQVSMSWGSSEYWSEVYYDSHFNYPGVTFLASAGDNGAGVSYPAASPFVTAVGGTSLQLDAATWDRLSESAWAGSGGGTSVYEAKPSFQSGFNATSQRSGPDVAYSADSNTGFYVYNSSSGGSWYQSGGTSAGAIQWAGLISLVNQGRSSLGKPSLGSGLRYGTNQALYNFAGGTSYTNARGDFVDIAAGSNGLPAATGYDRATGLGSPVVNKLVWDLMQ